MCTLMRLDFAGEDEDEVVEWRGERRLVSDGR